LLRIQLSRFDLEKVIDFVSVLTGNIPCMLDGTKVFADFNLDPEFLFQFAGKSLFHPLPYLQMPARQIRIAGSHCMGNKKAAAVFENCAYKEL
jgi:hypothetical protein